MEKSKRNWIILLLVNSIIYSKLYYLFDESSVIGMLWNLSHYPIYFIVCIKISSMAKDGKKDAKKIVGLVSLYITLFGTILCSYFCSSNQPENIKGYVFAGELILTIYCLVIYYLISNMKKDVCKKSAQKSKIADSAAYDYIYDRSNSTENKAKVRSALWIVINSVLLVVLYLVLPLILRILRVNANQIVLAYCITIIWILICLYIKNYLFYQNESKKYYFTLCEIVGIFIASAPEYYYNVYLRSLSPEHHTIYLGCYLLIGLGTIPFLVISNKIITKYTEILS